MVLCSGRASALVGPPTMSKQQAGEQAAAAAAAGCSALLNQCVCVQHVLRPSGSLCDVPPPTARSAPHAAAAAALPTAPSSPSPSAVDLGIPRCCPGAPLPTGGRGCQSSSAAMLLKQHRASLAGSGVGFMGRNIQLTPPRASFTGSLSHIAEREVAHHGHGQQRSMQRTPLCKHTCVRCAAGSDQSAPLSLPRAAGPTPNFRCLAGM